MVELTGDQALALLPDRSPDAHKGDFGRILLLCGSRAYTGSAYLAAMGGQNCVFWKKFAHFFLFVLIVCC